MRDKQKVLSKLILKDIHKYSVNASVLSNLIMGHVCTVSTLYYLAPKPKKSGQELGEDGTYRTNQIRHHMNRLVAEGHFDSKEDDT